MNCSRYISDDFVLFSGDGSAHSTKFEDIDSVTRALLRALLSRVRKRSTKLIAALLFAFETRKRANPFATGAADMQRLESAVFIPSVLVEYLEREFKSIL